MSVGYESRLQELFEVTMKPSVYHGPDYDAIWELVKAMEDDPIQSALGFSEVLSNRKPTGGEDKIPTSQQSLKVQLTDKALSLIQAWANAIGETRDFPIFHQEFQKLKQKGAHFPPPSDAGSRSQLALQAVEEDKQAEQEKDTKEIRMSPELTQLVEDTNALCLNLLDFLQGKCDEDELHNTAADLEECQIALLEWIEKYTYSFQGDPRALLIGVLLQVYQKAEATMQQYEVKVGTRDAKDAVESPLASEERLDKIGNSAKTHHVVGNHVVVSPVPVRFQQSQPKSDSPKKQRANAQDRHRSPLASLSSAAP